jgi:hypothetical protein
MTIAMLGVAFGHPNMETSQHQTFFCEEFSKNEPIPINRGARRYFSTTE